MTLARKINKITQFHVIFARKMPEFYMIIALKYFPDFFWRDGNVSCSNTAVDIVFYNAYRCPSMGHTETASIMPYSLYVFWTRKQNRSIATNQCVRCAVRMLYFTE